MLQIIAVQRESQIFRSISYEPPKDWHDEHTDEHAKNELHLSPSILAEKVRRQDRAYSSSYRGASNHDTDSCSLSSLKPSCDEQLKWQHACAGYSDSHQDVREVVVWKSRHETEADFGE